MPLPKPLISRLENWKFQSAHDLLTENIPPAKAMLITKLSEMFGDCGWFAGAYGQFIAVIVDNLIEESADGSC